MIEAHARIVDADGDYVRLLAERPSACGGCQARQGCGTSLIAQWFPQRRLEFRLRNDIGARVGDRVVIGMQASRLQQGALTLYGMPLAGLLLGAVAGEAGFAAIGLPAELGAVGAGLLGLIAALRFVRGIADRRIASGRGDIRLIRVAAAPAAGARVAVAFTPTRQRFE